MISSHKLALFLCPWMAQKGYDKIEGQAAFKKMVGPEPGNDLTIELRGAYAVVYNLHTLQIRHIELKNLANKQVKGKHVWASLGYEMIDFDEVHLASNLMPLLLLNITIESVEVKGSKDFTPALSQHKYQYGSYVNRQLFVKYIDKAGNRGSFFTSPAVMVKGKGVGSYFTLGATSEWFKPCQPINGVGYEPSIKPGEKINIQAKIKKEHATGYRILERVRVIGREIHFIEDEKSI